MLLAQWLRSAGYAVDCVATIAEMLNAAAMADFSAIILDMHLTDGNSLDFLNALLLENLSTKIIVLTAHGSVDLAVDALRRGASGFITKPTSAERLIQELSRLVPIAPSSCLASSLTECGIIGESMAMKKVYQILDRVKDVDSTVLIQGESGTGKELIARALHTLSPRRNERFEAINCAAIPETLLESELFGHTKGAFTDARQDRKGLFEVCSQGTLLLDEIGDMPLALQAKLLRVLQEREIMPLGSQRTIKIGTRIVAATNKNLVREVEAGRFRCDLYYRLSVVEVTLPSLRERSEDIPLLARYFFESFSKRFGKDLTPLPAEVLARMSVYPWPGNIRELQNTLERAVILATKDALSVDDIFPPHLMSPTTAMRHARSESLRQDIGSLEDERALFEVHYLNALLTMTHGNISLAAKRAGKFRADLYRLLGKYQIDPANFRNL